MKNLHYGHCLIGVAVAVVLLVALGMKASTVGFLAVVLACPPDDVRDDEGDDVRLGSVISP